MCLIIGSPGVGKTLLLKRLNTCSNRGCYSDVGEAPATISTVGTNLMNILTSRKTEITVRELGGCMAPIWHNYYRDCNALIFMVDLSNRAQISASCIQLLEVLTNPRLHDVPVLLLLNKMDVHNAMKRVEFDSIVRLVDILCFATQKITVLECSALTAQGLQETARWIQDHTKASQPS